MRWRSICRAFEPARRQDIRLTVGFTARVDVVLGLATVAETVTVSGAAPVVDVSATSGSTLLTNEHAPAHGHLPQQRDERVDAGARRAHVPRCRWRPDDAGEPGAARVRRRRHRSGTPIDGVQNFRLGTTFWDYQTFDEVRVQSTGADAERPTRGVQVTAVVKSGGNEFHGGGFWAGTNSSFQGNNIDQELEAAGITSGDALDSSMTSAESWGAASSGTSCGSTVPPVSARPRMTC